MNTPEYQKALRAADPERYAEYVRKWRKKNLEKHKTGRRRFNKKYYARFSGTSNNSNHKQVWTISDINLLNSNQLTDRELHKLIGRSVCAIQIMRSKMKRRDILCPVCMFPIPEDNWECILDAGLNELWTVGDVDLPMEASTKREQVLRCNGVHVDCFEKLE